MQIQTSDALFEQAMELANKSTAILQDADGLTAESKEQSERIWAASVDLFSRSDAMKNIEALKRQAHKPEDDIPEDDPASNTMQKKAKDGFGYETVGDFFKAVYHLKTNHIMAPQGLHWWDGEGDGKARTQHITEAKALAENVGATGGFLVPTEFQARILQVQETETVVRPRAEIIRMSRRTATIPSLDQTGTVTGGFSWFGGVVTYYQEEAASLTESSFTFRDTTLNAHTLTAYTRSSNQLLDDTAVSLEDFLMRILPRALAHQGDYDMLQGDGVGKPTGVVNSGATITVNREGTLNVTYVDITNMIAKALPSMNSIWVASQSILPKLLTMSGPSGNPAYLWGSAERGVPNNLLGRPIVFTDKLPVLGTAGDLMLCDFGYYLVGDRQAVTIDMSTHERFANDQSSWRAKMRFDGQPWLSAPITYRDGSTTVSPFVRLGDKST